MINVRMQHKEVKKLSPKITVVGVGGAGGNAVNNMITSNLEGVEFVVCNTDAQALESSLCENKLQLGVTVTGGLGAGARPEIGRAAAEESLDEAMHYMDGSNMVFITAGMGGGTGTGAAPVIARACREKGILTVGVVTKPFHFEGSLRMKMAEEGIRQMQDYVDTLIVIPNQNLFRVANEKTTFAEAFKMADSVLQAGVRGVTDLMVMPALINLDFADIRTAMMEMGKAMMGMGEGIGDRRAVEAAEAAINNPLLDDVSMKGARGVIINVTGGGDMTLFEVDEACNRIRDEVDPNANIIFGATFDDQMEGIMRVSVVATGIDVDVQKRSTGNLSTSMLNALTSAQQNERQQERKLDRTRPTTIASDTRVEEAAPAAPVRSPAGPASPHVASVMAVARSVSVPSSPVSMGATARKLEEEPEMFEQGEFVAEIAPVQSYVQSQIQAQTSAMRGTRYNDAFIPPAAVEVQAPRAETQYAPQPRVTESPVPQNQASSGNFSLRPPVPAQQKKRAQSLFERFTQGLRHEEEEIAETTDAASSGGSAGNAGGLRASPRQPYHQVPPQQGSLNIDAPAPAAARPGPQVEDELDIPAFLRRQAN
ncbi:MAG TPA: cell division protein FtsZ [Micavibrio sp.]|jgi:cell division protein FtsZ